MKTKINLKKGILLFTIVSMLIGCGITAIPLVVNKDVSLGIININGLQDSPNYFGELDLDLTSFLDEDELNGIESATLKNVILTLADYKNTVTQSEDFIGGLGFFVLKEGVPFDLANYSKHNMLVLSSGVFKKGLPVNFTITDKGFDITSLIKNKKVKIGVAFGAGSNIVSNEKFNDAAFSFSAKVETEVQVAL